MGIFQGLTVSEMYEKFPQERKEYETNNDDYIIPKGESLRQCRERGSCVFNKIAERHLDETVVVITHGCLLMSFFEVVLNLPPGNWWRFKPDNANFSSFEYVNRCWSLVVWNDVSHLDNIKPLTV